jgi:hypothetical protein
MRYFMTVATVLLLFSAAGCFGGRTQGSVLLGRMPRGYDMYLTFHPEAADMAGILDILKDNLPEDVIEKTEDSCIRIDPFSWQEWKSGMGLRDEEIGVFSLVGDDELVALVLPCTDQAKLENFIEENDFGDTEFFPYGEYIVMVINWEDDDLLDDLEENLGGATLSSDNEFTAMEEAVSLNGSCLALFVTDEVTDVPIYGAFSSSSNESTIKITVSVDDDDIQQYIQMAGNDLQSSSIVFPENTVAAVRFTLDMNRAAEGYADIAEESDDSGFSEIEAGLPFIGFDSMEEFLSVFRGDFCVTLQNMEIGENSDPENMEGIIAVSLTDTEKLDSSLSAVSAFTEALRREIDDVVTYEITDNGASFWYFISDDVFYFTMNVRPEEVMNGVSAGDYFQGIASEGFFGGAVDPEGVMEGIQVDDDVETIIATLFENRTVFSVSRDGNTVTSTAVAGPDVLKSLISLAVLGARNDISEKW